MSFSYVPADHPFLCEHLISSDFVRGLLTFSNYLTYVGAMINLSMTEILVMLATMNG
jgi:hypothetical protein